MSWRVAIPYYFVAILFGSLVVALTYQGQSLVRWGTADGWMAGFSTVLILALLGAFPALLVHAFILHRLASALGLTRMWHWMAAGGAAGVAVTWTLGRIGYLVEAMYFAHEWQWLKAALVFPFMGPMMYLFQPLWLSVLSGAATAFVLHRCVRRLGRGGGGRLGS